MTDIPEDQLPQDPSETLVQLRAPYFCAGLVLRGGVCVEAAPILARLCLGKRSGWLRKFFKDMHWKAVIVPPHQPTRSANG